MHDAWTQMTSNRFLTSQPPGRSRSVTFSYQVAFSNKSNWLPCFFFARRPDSRASTLSDFFILTLKRNFFFILTEFWEGAHTTQAIPPLSWASAYLYFNTQPSAAVYFQDKNHRSHRLWRQNEKYVIRLV